MGDIIDDALSAIQDYRAKTGHPDVEPDFKGLKLVSENIYLVDVSWGKDSGTFLWDTDGNKLFGEIDYEVLPLSPLGLQRIHNSESI